MQKKSKVDPKQYEELPTEYIFLIKKMIFSSTNRFIQHRDLNLSLSKL